MNYGQGWRALLANGYAPIPVHPQTKKGVPGWSPITDPEIFMRWSFKHPGHSIGLLGGGNIIGFDIDSLDLYQGEAIEKRIRNVVGGTPFVRVGLWPKRLLVYGYNGDFRSKKFKDKDGKIIFEIKGAGQQVVAFGKYTDGGRYYEWLGLSPFDLPASELPAVMDNQIERIVREVEALIPDGLWEGRRGKGASSAPDPTTDSATGTIIDGRNEVARNIRWQVYHQLAEAGPVDLEEFSQKSWEEFRSVCALDPTSISDNSYNWTWWEDICQGDFLRLKDKVKGRLDGIEPTFKIEPVSLAEGEATLRHYVRTFLEVPSHTVIRATAGLGKTRTAIEELAAWHGPGKIIHYFTDRVANGEAVAAQLRALGLTVLVHTGRDKAGCRRPEDIQEVVTRGLPAQRLVCEPCPHFVDCAYQQRLTQQYDTYIFTHDYLRLKKDKRIPPADVQVIDESPLNKLIDTWTTSTEELAGWGTLERRIVEGLRQGNLRREVEPEQLKARGRTLWTDYEALTEQRIARGDGEWPPKPPVKLLRMLAEELNARPFADDIWCLKLIGDGTQIVCRRRAPYIRSGVSTLILDATASERIYRLLFGDLAFHRIDVERQATVTQIMDRRFTNGDLNRGTGKLFERLQRVIDTAAQRHEQGVVITLKAVEDAGKLRLPPGWLIDHFGNLRGTNSYEQCECVIIIGRNWPRNYVTENIAAALTFNNPDVAVDLLSGPRASSRGYRMRDGSLVGVTDLVWPAPLLQAIQEQHTHEESIQALDRVRSVRNIREIIICSSHVLDITVDRLVTFKDFSAHDELAAAHEVSGPVLPLRRDWLQENLGISRASAERFSSRARGETPSKVLKRLISSSEGVLIQYRTKGQRGPDSWAHVTPNTPLPTIKPELIRLHGGAAVTISSDVAFKQIAPGVFTVSNAA